MKDHDYYKEPYDAVEKMMDTQFKKPKGIVVNKIPLKKEFKLE